MTTIDDLQLMADHERRMAQLAAENRRLKRQVRTLRNRLRPGRAQRVITNAEHNARFILHARHADMPHTRRALADMGIMSEFQFGWALGLLTMCGLRSFRPSTLAELDAALRRIEKRRDLLLTMAPETAMHKLRAAAGAKYQRNAV